MIRTFAAASFDHETEQPLCLTIYAQGPADELGSYAARMGLSVVTDDWNGQPMAAVEIILRDIEQVYSRVMRLLSSVDKSAGGCAWLTDFAPGLDAQGVNTNLYQSREAFLEAIGHV